MHFINCLWKSIVMLTSTSDGLKQCTNIEYYFIKGKWWILKRLIIWWIYKYRNILWSIETMDSLYEYYQYCMNNDFKLIAWFYRFERIASQLFSAFVHRFKPIASFIAIYFIFQHLKIALNIRIAISFKVCSLKIAILNLTRIIRSFS